MGCLVSFTCAVVIPAFFYVLTTPWTFHMGGRWTPLVRWDGVGRLRDSAGFEYVMYARLSPYVNVDSRDGSMSVCCELSGSSQVCTAGGARYAFHLNGGVSGAWLHSNGAKLNIALTEAGHPKLPRQFQFSGVWRGPDIVLDDQRFMIDHFLPGGNLTPNPINRTPIPDKHAKVTLSWGSPGDFDALCASLAKH